MFDSRGMWIVFPTLPAILLALGLQLCCQEMGRFYLLNVMTLLRELILVSIHFKLSCFLTNDNRGNFAVFEVKIFQWIWNVNNVIIIGNSTYMRSFEKISNFSDSVLTDCK